MQRKVFGICVFAAYVVAAVAPPLASARPVLTRPTGTVLSAPRTTTTTNVGNITFTSSTGTLTCTSGKMTGELTSNSTAGGFNIEVTSAEMGGSGARAAFEPANECTGSNFFTPNTSVTPIGLPWCISATSVSDTFNFEGCGAHELEFNIVVTGVGTCRYDRLLRILGSLVTDGEIGENTFSISNGSFILFSGPGLCPSELKLSMQWRQEEDATLISDPIYLSS